jgi:hypothetical protein
MTDKPTPTDAELEALLLDKLPASKHYIRPVIEKMVAAMQAAIDKWGQPAQAADSVPAVEREQERIAFKDAHRHLELYEVPDAWGRPMFKHSHVEASWLGWIARASHGQAPATVQADSVQEDAAP